MEAHRRMLSRQSLGDCLEITLQQVHRGRIQAKDMHIHTTCQRRFHMLTMPNSFLSRYRKKGSHHSARLESNYYMKD